MRDMSSLSRSASLCYCHQSEPVNMKSWVNKRYRRSLSVPDLKKMRKEWDTYQHSDLKHRLPDSTMQIDLLNIKLDHAVKRPTVRLKMGPAQYYSKRSNTATGDWNEGFVFCITYHAQLFNTIEFDLYDTPHKRWPTTHHIGKAKLKISNLAGRDSIFVTFLPIYEYRSKRLLPSDFHSTLLKTDVFDSNTIDKKIGDLNLIGSMQIRIRYRFQEPVTVDDNMPNEKVLKESQEIGLQDTHLSSENSSSSCTLESHQPSLLSVELHNTRSNRRTSYGRGDLAQDQTFVNDVFKKELSRVMTENIPGSSDSLYSNNKGRRTKKKKKSISFRPTRNAISGSAEPSKPRRHLNWIKVFVAPAKKLPLSSRGRRYGFSQNDSDDNFKFNPDENSDSSSSVLSSPNGVKNRLKHKAKKKAQHIIDSVDFGDRNFASQWMQDSFEDVALSHPLVDKLVGLVVSKQTQAMVRAIIKTANSFGQGFRVTGIKLLKAALLLQQFYDTLPKTIESEAITDGYLMDQACHYFAYAVVAYGWRGLVYMGAYGQYFRGARGRRSNRLAIIRYLHLDPEDLLGYEYSLRKGASFQPSYFVALDKRRHTIVLSIRGTWSLYDAITDLVCEYMPWKGGLVHSGMLASAQWFYTNIIPQIFRYIHHHSKHITRFVVTGHSLGAGTASLLTMMVAKHVDELRALANNPNFDFHCYSYAPPAASSLNLGKKYENYITSFIYQDDIVGKLSYGTAMKLKELVLDTISAYSTLGGFRKTMGDPKARNTCFDIISQSRESLNSSTDSAYPSLYIPGRLIHIQRDISDKDKHSLTFKKSSFSLHDTTNDICKEMKLTKTCIEDHMISAYQDAFVALREEYPSPFADSKH